MSAELLREAANAVRAEWEPEQSGPFRNAARTHLAVANLLDAEASLIASVDEYAELHMPLNGARVDLLAAIANAYLGRDA